MKKIIPLLSLIAIAFLSNGCSSDLENNEDVVLKDQIQGRWKLTASQDDTQPVPVPVAAEDSYEMSFHADKTFVSDEENGFSGGTYTVYKDPNNNLRMVFKKQWDAKVVYKYIRNVTANELRVQAVSGEPIEEDNFLSSLIFTRIP